ncbi:hypothetical protein [Paraburkholderia sp.]|jgi:hypothetical protein|uniref:hypothetical protein n=1 Tax=Paraburkholderia sp. TaxID=1926495 RepID=UPI002F3EA9E4
MRVAFGIELIGRTSRFAIRAALASGGLPPATCAQAAQAAPDRSARLAEPNPTLASRSASARRAAPASTGCDAQPVASASRAPDDAASVNDISLDDQLLSRQRAGALRMSTVAPTPRLMQAGRNHVTLWDEIAPPSPLPIPVDAARAA